VTRRRPFTPLPVKRIIETKRRNWRVGRAHVTQAAPHRGAPGSRPSKRHPSPLDELAIASAVAAALASAAPGCIIAQIRCVTNDCRIHQPPACSARALCAEPGWSPPRCLLGAQHDCAVHDNDGHGCTWTARSSASCTQHASTSIASTRWGTAVHAVDRPAPFIITPLPGRSIAEKKR
jgi:hypothetical protein